jgi:hypothetical protein
MERLGRTAKAIINKTLRARLSIVLHSAIQEKAAEKNFPNDRLRTRLTL